MFRANCRGATASSERKSHFAKTISCIELDDLAILFNRLSNFSRIMNVENIQITALPAQATRTITSDFVAKTFVYVEPAEPTKPAGAAKPGGAAPAGGS